MIKYTKNCTKCSITIIYTNLRSFNKSLQNNTLCRSCRMKGTNNPFYGKKHTEKCKEHLSKIHSGKSYSINTQIKIGQRLNKNSNLPLRERLHKAGIDSKEVELRYNQFRSKLSAVTRGVKNPMFGKTTPIGSGNGWSGWYKGWYFRSLLELSFMIKIIERFRFSWESAETKALTVTYQYNGSIRTYRADFLLNNKYLVECKPKKLWLTHQNILKQQAMRNFCASNGLIFKFIDIPRLSYENILELHKSSSIKFLPRYEERFKSWRDSAKST